MAGPQRLLATVMAFFLTGTAGNPGPDALGVVAQAYSATLGSEPAVEGTTVYDGDRLATSAGGSLQLLVGDAMLSLADQSDVIVHRETSGTTLEFDADLWSGGAVLSLTSNVSGKITARSASVRPLTETRGTVRVQVLGAHELLVFAQRGPAQISYRDESEIVPEGKSYCVLLNASEDDGAPDSGAKKPQTRRKALVLIAVGAAAAGGIIAGWKTMGARGASGGTPKGVESPDRP